MTVKPSRTEPMGSQIIIRQQTAFSVWVYQHDKPMWDVRRAQEKMLVNPKMEMCGFFNYIWAKNYMSKAFEQQTTKIKFFHLIFAKITT